MVNDPVMFPINNDELSLSANFGSVVRKKGMGMDTEYHIVLPDKRTVVKTTVSPMPVNTVPRFALNTEVLVIKPDLDPEKIRMPREFWQELGACHVSKIRWYPTTGFLYLLDELPIHYQRWLGEQQLAVPVPENVFDVLDTLRTGLDADTLNKVRAGLVKQNKGHLVANL